MNEAQFVVDEVSDAYWRVRFGNGPINLFDPDSVELGADDVPAARAEQYGYVNRVAPDEALDELVDAFARRVAGFDKTAVARTKALVDTASLPPEEEFGPALAAFFQTSGRPESAARSRYLFDHGYQTPDGVERDLGSAVAQYAADPAAIERTTI